MIVADASWIIALRDPADGHHQDAVALHEAFIDQPVLLHPVTLAECLVAPAALNRLDEASRQLRASYEVVTFDMAAPERWATLRATTGLRLPDVIVLDTAIVHGARQIVTFDMRLADAAAKHGLLTH